MSLILAQFLTGLANASSLFLAASGLSLIFGVTRIVNFAHGAFYMLGAYVAYTLTVRMDGAFGFWAAILLAAGFVAVLGAILEATLMRRIYPAPELFALLATFGVTLMVEDLVVILWGPQDLVGPRAPGLDGAIRVFGLLVPTYDLVLILMGPAILAALWLILHRTRWGILVRAATADRGMVAALGVNQKWLFTGVFTLGVFLAALGGALQIPRTAVTHQMDLSIIVEVFVVVVIGGLGSIAGAFVAAVVIAELSAFGILVFPGVSLVLAFLVMGLVLVFRPLGLFGRPVGHSEPVARELGRPWRPWPASFRAAVAAALLVAALLPTVLGSYGLAVGAQMLIAVVFALGLQFMMSVGGLVSFGHAAFFGLGAYGSALAVQWGGLPMELAFVCGVAAAAIAALAFGWFSVRLEGVYLAMLTLAFAQILWSIAFQWVDVTGGDNGLLGIWPADWASDPAVFYWLCLAAAAATLALTRRLAFAPFGYRLRALRDAPRRAAMSGIDPHRTRLVAFTVSGTLAGVAGALFAFLKGSVFPDVAAIPFSIDALVMVLAGGVATVSGGVLGALFYTYASIELVSQTDLSRLVLGAVIVVLVVAFPQGIAGYFGEVSGRWGDRMRESAGARVGPKGPTP